MSRGRLQSSTATLAPPWRSSNYSFLPSAFARTSAQLQYAAQIRWRTSRHTIFVTHVNRGCDTARRWTTNTTNLRQPNNLLPSTPTVVLTSYQPPKVGLLAHLPGSWVPYAELMRLDKPAGTYYLFLPCLFSTLLAAPLATPIVPPSTILGTSLLFFTGALIMRGAGCTINDLWDRNLDPQVTRTRLRPIARGAISVRQAVPFLGVQLLAGLALLLQFPMQCFFYATPSLLLVTLYPLAKRVTNYPQFVLGLTFSWGAFMGFPALGVDLIANTPALLSAACLYGSCVAWTIVYDMIYAYQDIRDDAKAGIKSIALAQEANAKAFLTTISSLQVALLAGAGVAAGTGPVFYVGACGGAAATLGLMIRKVNLGNVVDCWAWFKNGAWLIGGAISLGIGGEYLVQYIDPGLVVE